MSVENQQRFKTGPTIADIIARYWPFAGVSVSAYMFFSQFET